MDRGKGLGLEPEPEPEPEIGLTAGLGMALPEGLPATGATPLGVEEGWMVMVE